MTKHQETLSKKIARLRSSLSQEIGSSSMDMVDELVNLEIELEQECNQ